MMMARQTRRLAVLTVLSLACGLLVACCAGCAFWKRPEPPVIVKGSTVAHVEGAVKVTLMKGLLLPKEVDVVAGEDEQTYIVPPEVEPFPWGMVVGLLATGGIACAAALWLGLKPFLPIIGGATAVAVVSVVVKLVFWQILLGITGVSVLAALVFGLMWFLRSRLAKKVVTGVEAKAKVDQAFNAGVSDAMTDINGDPILSKAEERIVDKMRGKK